MTTPNPHTTNYTGAAAHETGPSQASDNPYAIWYQLQQHQQSTEYYRQIRACLFANDYIWSLIGCLRALRTDPSAADILEDLHISAIYLIPPTDIWDLLVRLRMQPSWPSCRDGILSQMNQYRHQSYSTASTRSSAASYKSFAHLSSASGRSFLNIPSSSSFIDTVQEGETLPDSSHPARSDTVRHAPIPKTRSGKSSRMAPKGQSFTCPHSPCRGKYAWKRAGDFENHYFVSLSVSQNVHKVALRTWVHGPLLEPRKGCLRHISTIT